MFTGSSRLLPVTVLFLIIVGLSACQPSTVDVPATETQSPPSTVTPAQPSPTPIPTANFAPEDVLGIWMHEDQDRGILFLVFLDDGTYRASHGSPDVVIHSGKYTLEDRVFTFVNGWECPDSSGVYVIRISGGGKYLLFEKLDDTCADRPSALKSIRWDQVEATPAP